MKRYLVWHIPHVREGDESQGPRFYADHDYGPGAFRLMARQAPNAASGLQVDIRVDDVTIMTDNYAVLNEDANLEENAEDYTAASPFIEEGSVITFHIITTGGAEDITGQLELDSLSDEDE